MTFRWGDRAPLRLPRPSERVSRVLVLSVLASATFWVHLAQFGQLLEWDSHIFLVVATQIVRHGLLPYRDLWELKPPGVFYYLAGVFTVLPEALWSVRFTDAALYLAGSGAFYWCCRRETNRTLALIGTVSWLYLAHHGTFNLGGLYTEEYAAIAAIVAVASAAHYASSGAARWAFVSGVAVSAAALFKHPGAAALVPAFVLLTRHPRLLAYGLLLLGVLLPLALVVAYFWSRGALAEFLDLNVWALVVHGRLGKVDETFLIDRLRALATQSWTMFEPFPVLTGSLLLGVPIALLRPSWLRVATLLWMVVDFAGVAAQRQFAQHHFILTFPSTCLLGTLAVAWLVQPRFTDPWYLRWPRVALCILVLGYAAPELHRIWVQRWPVVREHWGILWAGPRAWPRFPARAFETGIGEYVREHTAPTDSIHVQGYGPSLLGIYWAAERQVATRYFYDAPYPLPSAQVLADLQRRQPAYVVVASRPPFLFLMPWLVRDYSIETVRWHDYAADLWVRNQPASFSAGSMVGLTAAPEWGGLTLPIVSPAEGGFPTSLPEARRGRWTSPVVPARGDQKTYVDWNPRADLAWNRTGGGFPQVEATTVDVLNDPRAVLGVPTLRGFWTGWPQRGPQALTVRLGFPAVVDQIDIVPRDAQLRGEDGCAPALVAVATPANTTDPGAFEPMAGTWDVDEAGAHRFRFPPRVISAVRVVSTVASCGATSGIRRLRVHATGTGIIARYRTGPGQNLDAAPWHVLDDGKELLWPPTDRYLQVQYELWSNYTDLTPVLRWGQVGRLRFEIEPPRA